MGAQLNPGWFQDYSVDFLHQPDWNNQPLAHACTYINGETRIRVPLGRIYV
jgi:hypothetical protein